MHRFWLLLLILWLPAALAQTGAPGYPPLEQFDDMIERPLFDATRRPRANESDDDTLSESAAEMREKWRLSGVAWENNQRLALFSEREGAARERIRTGMYLDGNWQLEEITEDSVTLTDEGQRLRLELWEPREASTRPLPAPEEPQNEEQAPERKTDNGGEPATEQGRNGESS
ncbi:hypothetical protein [Oceanimonas smirnovii]|uniref:hypothetical protein n=1 Tax=Oceanimonas smirnovii TaxID=264574 RepID=UPI003FCF7074